MLIKVLWVALALFLFWLGIKILVKMFPVSRSQLRNLGDTGNRLPIPYSSNPKIIGLIYFIFKFVPFGLTAGIEREQKKVLQKKLNEFNSKRKKVEKQQLKYRASPYNVLDSQLDEWQNLVDSNEFDYAKLIGEIDKSERLHRKYLKSMLDADKLLTRCFEAIKKLSELLTNADDIEALAAEEDEICALAKATVQLDNSNAMKKYLADLEDRAECIERDVDAYANQASTTSPVDSNLDPYKVLGLDIGASAADIKKAYRALAIKYHPDRKAAEMAKISDSDVKAEIERTFDQKFKAINDAYTKLTT